MKILAKNGLGTWRRVYSEVERKVRVKRCKKLCCEMTNESSVPSWTKSSFLLNFLPFNRETELLLKRGEHSIQLLVSFLKSSNYMASLTVVISWGKLFASVFIWAQWLSCVLKDLLWSLSLFFPKFSSKPSWVGLSLHPFFLTVFLNCSFLLSWLSYDCSFLTHLLA